MSPIRWVSFALAAAGVVECSGVGLEEFESHKRRLPSRKCFGLYQYLWKRLLQRVQQKLLESLHTVQVLLYSYYFVIAFL